MNRIATLRVTSSVLSVALLLAAAPAQAGWRSGVKSISAVATQAPETIRVYGDGSRFTHVTQSHVWFRAQTAAECKSQNDLMYSMLASGSVTTASGQLGPSQGPYAHVDTNGRESAFKAPLAELFAPPRKNPAELCNLELERRVAAGDSRIRLVRDGFGILLQHDLSFLANCKYTGIYGAEFDGGGNGPGGGGWPAVSWDGWGSRGFSVHSSIQCVGSTVAGGYATPPAGHRPPTGADDLAVPFQVRGAALEVTPKNATAECPLVLDVEGSVTVLGEGTVRYRMEHKGALGPVREMHFPAGAPKTRTLSFQLPVGSPPDGGSGGQLTSAGGGVGGVGGIGGIGGLVAQPAPENKVSGSLRLIVVSPQAGVSHSNPTGYSVTCRAPGKSGNGTSDDKPRRWPTRR